MSSLVLELQQEALNPAISVSDLLRKAKVVAAKLNLPDMEKWIDCESNGYSDDIEIPEYRKIACKFGFLTVRGFVEAFYRDSREIQISLNTLYLNYPIATIELHEDLYHTFDTNNEIELSKVFAINNGQPVRLTFENQYQNVLQYIRNKILDWSLNLEKSGILGEGLTFSLEERQKASSITNIYNINNPSQSPIQFSPVNSPQSMTINQNDMGKVKDLIHLINEKLSSEKTPNQDIEEVKSLIQSIDAQLKSPKPRKAIIVEGLNSLKSILAGIAGNLWTPILIQKFNELSTYLS